jgi:hypothetical protein
MSNKLILPIVGIVIVVLGLGIAAIALIAPAAPEDQTPTGPLDFTVTASSDCLRFLNSSVPVVYVPFTVDANQNMELTINATKMPGGANGWTDVYLYEGYWDNGTNHLTKAGSLYPIINDIKSVDFEIKANQPYNRIFGDGTLKSYTVFFVVPPGGPATIHVTLKPTN